MASRLQKIYRHLTALIEEFSPDEVAVEELYFSSNVSTAMAVAQARGVAILASAQSGVPLGEYSPPQIKQAVTGSGRAPKRQVQLMVKAVLELAEIPRPDHAADALAVALCHLHHAAPVARARAQAERAQVERAQSGETMSVNKQLLSQQRRRRR
jgi:crossover junction endodeoxyribonuclease RuvC